MTQTEQQTDAPERIWVEYEDIGKDDPNAWVRSEEYGDNLSNDYFHAEYIRADIAEAEKAALRAEVERCHERLEITHVWKVDNDADTPEGEDFPLVKVDIPENERPTAIDGIACRDATIELLEEDGAALRAQLAAAREEGFLLGFRSSGEGWNGEHGCSDPEHDDYWLAIRETVLSAALVEGDG